MIFIFFLHDFSINVIRGYIISNKTLISSRYVIDFPKHNRMITTVIHSSFRETVYFDFVEINILKKQTNLSSYVIKGVVAMYV